MIITRRLLSATLSSSLALVGLGCGSLDKQPGTGCPDGKICDSGDPPGPPRPLRADGTVDITPDEAWPNRQPEPEPLSAEELARACAALAACVDVEPSTGETLEETRRFLQALCIQPAQSYFWEERAVPTVKKNERWTFEARQILSSGGGCAAALAASTDRAQQIYCEEAGCWWSSSNQPVPSVTCDGDVATLESAGETITRDCARSFASCDPASPTGCTDRAPTACEHPAKDRCDQGVRIGCDGNGRVSFHDCTRVPGGQCLDGADGPSCVYPQASCPTPPSGCTGSTLELCVLGTLVDVDCTSLGLSGCSDGLCTAN